MVRFMIYLLETGFCLSLLYLAYWLFLRKETYFGFNRIFLVGSIALTLAVPLLHLNFFIPQGSYLEDPALGIVKLRNYYEELIRTIDADFGAEPGSEHTTGMLGSDLNWADEGGRIPSEKTHGVSQDSGGSQSRIGIARTGGRLSVSGILLIIYIGGVVYFLARFVYLVIRLFLLARRNGVTRQDDLRMVEIEEDISPFSFFRFLFINYKSFNDSELLHVMEHEKVHIRQRHSMDHLFAHGLAVFQWFNPFAWQIRSALKTTHEYIADRQVIDRGIEPIDYQSLLLKQVIGYHSVELVNNFNLKPIKKRIAMMNKTRSGMPAKFKAMLVIPIAIVIFFLFADFTLKGSGNDLLVAGPLLEGLWVKQSEDDFSNTLFIQNDRFSFTEGIEIREYYLKSEKGALILSEREGGEGIPLRYESNGDKLTLWWSDTQGSQYIKSDSENTLDHLLTMQGREIDLPYLSQYRLMDNDDLIYSISLDYDNQGNTDLLFNGKSIQLSELSDLVEKERSKLNKLDLRSLTALFHIDRETPMSEVDLVRQELRRINALHFAEGGYPQGDINLSPMLYHAVALPRLLPPLNAKELDKREVEKAGGKVHTIDLAARNTTPRDVDNNLQQFIRNNEDGKYVISLEFDEAIPYGQYVEAVDMVFNVVYKFRKELALKKYQVPYEQLGDDLQREIRKAYPMALSEAWSNL